MLALDLCIFPNPFFWFGDAPYEALWHVTLLCAILLGIEAIALLFAKYSPAKVLIAALLALVAAALTITAGHMATVGMVCAGVPGASQASIRAAQESSLTLTSLQLLGLGLCSATLCSLILGARNLTQKR